MKRTVLYAKIHGARITATELYYEGSITIDQDLLDRAGILPYELVQVVNLNNGERFETYTIPGPRGSGVVCLNGPAARKGYVGDVVIILAYAHMEEDEARGFLPKVVVLGEGNQVVRVASGTVGEETQVKSTSSPKPPKAQQ
ncbi:MAG: aspartate 1-decarboxylase [Candidatus Latescibacterota bacterium]|nr:MAG: aspartate 1-decarboxylase [Candidatus Latescibacterota bacterium]RKY72825.1 MAG: aspartate 1-decarboxylase [Candidatus Latescibacterota bacterium]